MVARSGFPSETLQSLRYLLAPEAAGAAAAAPSAFIAAGSAELEAKLAAVLVHACEQELRSLSEPIV